jgi:outer membrane protein TolC
MKKLGIIFLTLAWIAGVSAQETSLTLQQCYMLALKNHPLSAQNALYEKASQLQGKILDENNLPQLNLNGQATYQNAVTELPIKIPGVSIPEIHKDQYKLTLDATQVIYDGGYNRNQQMIEKNNLEINKQGTETDLFKLRERINQLYFNVLLAENSISILISNQEELDSRLKKIESGIKNGTVLPFNAAVLKAEILKVNQKQIEAEAQKKALISMLGVLTGTEISNETRFVEPDMAIIPGQYLNLRPEFKLFDLQEHKIDALKSLTAVKWNPRFIAFGDVGYGRPGFNMFKEEADLFYIIGAKATWNFWNWHQTRQELQILDVNKEIIENQKKSFDLNTRAAIQQYLSDITKLNTLLESDDKIMVLRKEITTASASQMENGIITATEYLTEYNSEIQARLSKNLHQVQLLQAKAGYLAATGNL